MPGLYSDYTIFFGASNEFYGFRKFPWGTTFQKYAVVYVISNPRGIIYIGQTGNLPERFSNHHLATQFQRYGATQIALHFELSEGRRLQIERDLIARYRPALNTAQPPKPKALNLAELLAATTKPPRYPNS